MEITDYSNKALAKRIRRFKGKVEMPVLAPGGLYYLFVEKKDLLRQLDSTPDIAIWKVIDEKDGVLTLCDISEDELYD